MSARVSGITALVGALVVAMPVAAAPPPASPIGKRPAAPVESTGADDDAAPDETDDASDGAAEDGAESDADKGAGEGAEGGDGPDGAAADDASADDAGADGGAAPEDAGANDGGADADDADADDADADADADGADANGAALDSDLAPDHTSLDRDDTTHRSLTPDNDTPPVDLALDPKEARRSRIVFGAVGGVLTLGALGLAGTSGYFMARGRDLRNQVDALIAEDPDSVGSDNIDQLDPRLQQRADLIQDGMRQNRLAIATAIPAGILLGTGVAMIILAAQRGRTKTKANARLAPVFGRTAAGLSLTGRF